MTRAWTGSENEVLRRILGHDKEAVTGGCKKLHNEKLLKFYSSPCRVRSLRWSENVTLIEGND
jgi:hypothetical protein